MSMNFSTKTFLGSLVFAVAAFVHAQAPITNFSVVVPGKIYRGALPDAKGMNYLKTLKIKTDVNLVTSTGDISLEMNMARARGMNYVSFPLSFLVPNSDRDLKYLVAFISEPVNQPVYVHCRHGEDRTGLVIGLERVFTEGWTPEAAYQEMLDFNFHPYLFFLDDSFRSLTGLDD